MACRVAPAHPLLCGWVLRLSGFEESGWDFAGTRLMCLSSHETNCIKIRQAGIIQQCLDVAV